MTFTRDMIEALEKDGEKLRQLTGEDHGPIWLDSPEETIEQIKERRYECFIEDHEPLPWTPGRCAGYAGRGVHLMRCKRKDGHGRGGLFCAQHAKTGGC